MIILSICILFILSGVARAEDSSSSALGGELHCYLGVVGIVLVILSLGFGLLTSSRFGRIKHLKTVPLHSFFSILVSVFFTGEFLFGLLKKQWLFILNYHSIIGLSLVIVAWVAVVMSPCVAGKKGNWKVSSKIHAILALFLLVLVVAQVLNGYLFLEG